MLLRRSGYYFNIVFTFKSNELSYFIYSLPTDIGKALGLIMIAFEPT